MGNNLKKWHSKHNDDHGTEYSTKIYLTMPNKTPAVEYVLYCTLILDDQCDSDRIFDFCKINCFQIADYSPSIKSDDHVWLHFKCLPRWSERLELTPFALAETDSHQPPIPP